MNQLDFRDRHAVVTGAATGLGYAVAQRLIESGGTVTLWDMSEAGLQAAADRLGSRSTTVAVDISDHESVVTAVTRTRAFSPRIDSLVNSAGITGPNAKLCEYSPEAWRKVFDVNVHGTFYCSREIGTIMRQQSYGRIVNIASVAGKDGNPNASAYSASKAAVIGLTKSLGKELADVDVRVNCVTPAAVKTAIFEQMSPEHIAFMLSKIPMNRFGTPEEVAAMVCWLCTEECSFSTGAVFDLSGGRSTY